MEAKEFDVVIIGAGIVGLSAAVAAAKRGDCSVVCLDIHEPANQFGASGDGLRLFRLSYFEHASYVPLLNSAIEGWKSLGDDLYVPAGGLYCGPADSILVTGSLESALQHEIDYELLEANEVMRRFPQFDLPPNYLGFFESKGGYVHSKRATRVMALRAESLGATIVQDRVLQIQAYQDGWMVTGEGQVLIAPQVIVCAGNATGDLVPGVAPFLSCEPHVVAWFESDWKDLPGFGVMNESEEMLYGFPAVDIVPGVKLGGHHNFYSGSPNDQQRGISELAKRFLPSLSQNIVGRKVCDYDVSPDSHFMIGELETGLTVACGFSGHGYKFGSVIGEVVLAASMDMLDEDLSFLDVNRFTSTSGLT